MFNYTGKKKLKKEKIMKEIENVQENRKKTETRIKLKVGITEKKTDIETTRIEKENTIQNKEPEADLVLMKIEGMRKETEEPRAHVQHQEIGNIAAEKN
jgi:hypothetical protein